MSQKFAIPKSSRVLGKNQVEEKDGLSFFKRRRALYSYNTVQVSLLRKERLPSTE